MGAGVRAVGVGNFRGLSGGGAFVNQRAAPSVGRPSPEPMPKSSTRAKDQPVRTLEFGAGGRPSVLDRNKPMAPARNARPRSLQERVLPDAPRVQKPPTAPGKVETKYGSYKPGGRGGAGSFPAEVTTTLDGGAKVIVKGTPKAGGTSLKDVTSVRGSVPIFGGAGSVVVGTEGGQSSIFGAGIKLAVGRNWTLKADTSALTSNDKKGVVTTGVSLSAPAGAAEVKADVKLVGAQEPGKSTTGYGVGVSVPLRQKDQAIEGRIGYENNPANPRKDQYSATLGYKFGSDKRIDVEMTTGADSGTAVQGRISIAKY
jgi:hypothetical protein